MKANAKVILQVDKKRDQQRFLIYVPSRVVKALNIKKGNILDLEIGNPNPDYVEEPTTGKNFKPKEPLYKSEEEK